MNTEIVTLDLSTRRKSIIGYSLGMAGYVVVVVALYPSFKDATNLDQLSKDSPGVAALFGISGSLTSPTGWLSANIYANFFPLLMLLITIGYGATSLAGQEADGHLELVLSLPFLRSSVVAQKVAALALQAAAFSAIVFGSAIVGRAFELTVDFGNLTTATLAVGMLGVDFGLLALAIGAATGARGTAIAISSAAAAASYLISSMTPLVSWLGSAKYASLFYWSVGDRQLEQGLTVGAFAVLLGVAIILIVVALEAFRRHDLS
ncbi:MAG: ABC transporter permease subunit [Ilumatobacteraceae bacterium]